MPECAGCSCMWLGERLIAVCGQVDSACKGLCRGDHGGAAVVG